MSGSVQRGSGREGGSEGVRGSGKEGGRRGGREREWEGGREIGRGSVFSPSKI